MSDIWWQPGAAPPRLPARARRFAASTAADFHDPPASLLRLPPLLRSAAAGRRTTTPTPRLEPPAVVRDCRHAGLHIGTAQDRRGFMKCSKAHSLDLRHLQLSTAWMARPRGDEPPPQPPLSPEDAVAALAAAGAAAQMGPRGAGATGHLLSPHDLLARRLAALLQPPPEALLRANGPLEWPGTLFPYQRDGIRALLQSPHLLLGDDLGLGKTVQAIAALRLLLHHREIERALIVVPASLLEQWRREIAHWAPELRVMVVSGPAEDRLWQWHYRAHLTLASYETVRADCTTSPHCGPRREEWGAVILDEAQRIKNRDTDVARACRRLPRQRSWALTGTPLENHARDVASILEFVRGGGDAVHDQAPVLTFGPALRALLGQFQLRRRKADVLPDLPPKITTDLVLPLTPAQRRAYLQVEEEGLAALRATQRDAESTLSVINVLDQIVKLKQICNFVPDTGQAGDGASRGTSAKLDDLANRLHELSAAGHKALVFTQYTSDASGARRIAAVLRGFAPLLYTGDMSLRERDRVVDQFQQETRHRVLLLSLHAGAQGLNLQCASYVFHFDRWWNPAIERQAEGRAHRMGQTQPVHVYRYIMAETIEQRIDEALKSKTELFDQLVDETSLDLSRLLDKHDLYGLVGLDPEYGASDHTTPEAATGIPGLALEQQVTALLARQGYRIEHTGAGPAAASRSSYDGGVDIIAERTDAVGTRYRLFVQCKDTARPTGVEVVRSLNGMLPQGDRGIIGVVVCPAGFTPEAQGFAAARHIQLWDAAKLRELERGRTYHV